MSSPPLLIVDPSVAQAEDEGVAEILGDWPGPARVLRPVLRPGDGPEPRDGYDAAGIVVMGSRASVHDDEPWIHHLGDWLAPLLQGQVRRPVLGICFGHQLIAHRAGGSVGNVHADGRKLVGTDVTHLQGCRLIPGNASLRVVISHREEVKSTPPGYAVVARRGAVAIDGLQHGELPVFAFQFHPEARGQFARAAGIDEGQIDDRLRADSRRLLEAFRRCALDWR